MGLENRKYPHLLPTDIEVWKRWLDLNGSRFTHFLYDLRVGEGRDPGEDYPSNIRRMALGLSQRRIDAVGDLPGGVAIIEITQDAGLTAVGQLTMYPVLYALDFPQKPIIEVILVCETVQSDIMPALATMNVQVDLV